MLTLLHALQEEGADHWRVVAQAWGIAYPEEARDALAEVITAMLSPERVTENYRSLPESARAAVDGLRAAGGKMPVAVFSHRHGEIRSMGPARRKREQPWASPSSPAELLWYRGWLGRTFLRTGGGTQEYFFLPGDLESLLPAGSALEPVDWPLRSYTPARNERPSQADRQAVEDACTLLAYLRNWPQPAARPLERWKPADPLRIHLHNPLSLPLLEAILVERAVLTGDPLQPDAEAARRFLEQEPESGAAFLLAAWRDSAGWNDLERMGGLRTEGNWPNDPSATRTRFLEALAAVPRGEWCTLESIVSAIHARFPEYLRPSSEFDAWLLRDETGEFLRGLESWDRVEGRLTAHLLTGPMAWLGGVDLTPREDPKAFRLTARAGVLWDETGGSENTRDWRARVRPDGTVLMPQGAPLLLRYQLARCSEWISRQGGVYVYRISPRSLRLAQTQGVRVDHILPLLEKLAGRRPAVLAGSLRQWEKSGSEALLRSGRILTARNPQTAAKIERRLGRSRGAVKKMEGPVWLVSPAGANALRNLLAEDGLLLDDEDMD
jgi:hypothetical protein